MNSPHAEATSKILILENAAFGVGAISSFFKEKPDLEIISCQFVTDACDILARIEPEMLICEETFEDGTFKGPIRCMLEMDHLVPFLCLLEASSETSPGAGGGTDFTVLKKPVETVELWDMVQKCLNARGQGHEFGFYAALEMARTGKATVSFRFGEDGLVQVRQGEVWFAEDSEGNGEPALKRLIQQGRTHKEGGFSCYNLGSTEVRNRNVIMTLDDIEQNQSTDFFWDTLPTPGEQLAKSLRAQAKLDDFLELALDYLLKKEYSEALYFLNRAHAIDSNNKVVNMNIMLIERMNIQPACHSDTIP